MSNKRKTPSSSSSNQPDAQPVPTRNKKTKVENKAAQSPEPNADGKEAKSAFKWALVYDCKEAYHPGMMYKALFSSEEEASEAAITLMASDIQAITQSGNGVVRWDEFESDYARLARNREDVECKLEFVREIARALGIRALAPVPLVNIETQPRSREELASGFRGLENHSLGVADLRFNYADPDADAE